MGTKRGCGRHVNGSAFLLLALSIVIFCAGQSIAPARAGEQALIQFDIPRQSLASALDSYSAKTGVVGLYRGQLAVGRMSKPVTGRYPLEAALALLLNDTGLAAQYASAHAFTLVPSRNGGPIRSAELVARAAIAQQDVVQRDYSALLQESIHAALCASEVTRPGDYRIALTFRVGMMGEIEQFSLLGSSGHSRRDDAISSALRRLAVGRSAPSHMSQPFTMIVLPSLSGGAIDCPPFRSASRHG